MNYEIPTKIRTAAHEALDRWFENAVKAAPSAEMGEQVTLKFIGMFSTDSYGRMRQENDTHYFSLGIETSTCENL